MTDLAAQMRPSPAERSVAPSKKVTAGGIGGAGLGLVIAWAWNMMMPDSPMPPEVAAAIAPLLGAAVAYFVSN